MSLALCRYIALMGALAAGSTPLCCAAQSEVPVEVIAAPAAETPAEASAAAPRMTPAMSSSAAETSAHPAPLKDEPDIDSIVQINVAASFEPQEAVGLLLSSQGVGEKRALKLEKVREGMYVVSFGYLKGEVRRDTFASAMVMSLSGKTAFGDIRGLYDSSRRESFYSLKRCPRSSAAAQAIDPSKYGNYELLMAMRLERREMYRKEIADLMKGAFLSDLDKLEKRLGLIRGRPLSADLLPIELIDRLSRLIPIVRDLAARDKKDSSQKN